MIEAQAVALVIAIAVQYTNLIAAWIFSPHSTIPPTRVNVFTFDIGRPIDIAIALGRRDMVEVLIQHGAELENTPWSRTCRALEIAAASGYLEVCDLVLRHLYVDQDHNCFWTYGKVIQCAATHQQWSIVKKLLDLFANPVLEEDIKTILCCAAKHGQDDIIRQIVQADWFTSLDYTRSKRFPLRDAASGGHLSTCLLLRDYKSWGQGFFERGEETARFVAKGGNIDIYWLINENNPELWSPGHEIHFLPIAAECGNIAFAKFAVSLGSDRKPKPNYLKPPRKQKRLHIGQFQDELRDFALLRAIVSGHVELARWMLQDLKVDMRTSARWSKQPDLAFLVLAIDTGRVDMVSLLKQQLGKFDMPDIGVNFIQDKIARSCRRRHISTYVENMCEKLKLRKQDYALVYQFDLKRDIKLAEKVAKEKD